MHSTDSGCAVGKRISSRRILLRSRWCGSLVSVGRECRRSICASLANGGITSGGHCCPTTELRTDMNESITYRQATVADVSNICELAQPLAGIHHRARPDIYTDSTQDFARHEAHWLPRLQAENRATFLASQGSVAVGFTPASLPHAPSPLP